MTCKDCVHYDVCQYHIDEETDMTVAECGKFKNKADFVEVVRCKDCKYRKKDKLFVSGYYCYLRPVNGGRFCEDDDFCSYGERKDGKDTNVPTK